MRASLLRLPKPPPPRLLSAHRSMATTTTTSKRPPSPSAPKPRLAARFVPDEAKKFVTPKGRLLTTADNAAFFLRHGIEPDNGTMARLSVKGLGSTTLAAFSARHVVSPYHLKFFDPRGHPLASATRHRYAREARSRPLWLLTTVLGGGPPVVRAKARRKLKRALEAALRRLGYDEMLGQGRHRQIRGTLWLTVVNPVGVLALDEERLGSGLAGLLHERYSSPVE